jgi:hypothetical protein
VATLYIFGLKRGVGVDTISAFLTRLRLDTQVGCSPSALRGVMHVLEAAVVKTAQTWEQDGVAHGQVREIIGCADETFLQRMMLVFQDLLTGYLLLEDGAADRTYTTWKAGVDERLTALGTDVLYVVSDRANALIQLAEQGFACLSMPDFFHVLHAIVKSYALAISRRVRQAQKALTHVEDGLPRPLDDREVQRHLETARAEVQRCQEVHRTYRQHLETLSLTLHPFDMSTSLPQTSAQVERRLQAGVDAIETFAEHQQVAARPGAMRKVRTQLPALAALVDFWWQGVRQDLEAVGLSSNSRQWVHECLLPMVYWDRQVARTRCRRRKAKLQEALAAVRAAFDRHAITQRLPSQILVDWHAWATDRVNTFQRASSAVEGRNGYLSQMHHNQRGLPKRRYKVWTVLHNFDCRASDGTTPASRFFRRSFPDLFETVLSKIDDLPRPRKRHQAIALTG